MLSGIMVSGYEADFVSFKAPSGQWNVDLDAYLTSMSASLGFNMTPHKFSLQFIPSAFNGASGQLPEIGTYTTYEVRQGSCSQGFLIAGNVVHADYQNATQGTVLKVDIDDRRQDILDVIKITTEDLGTDIPNGLVSVGEAYRMETGFTDVNGDIEDSRVKEYRNIIELGATYQQIYEAIIYASGAGRSAFDWTKLPHPSIVSSNTLGSLEPLRFKFAAIPLSQAISTILSDSAFDWYWGMQDDAIKVVNRKVTFDVAEDSLAVQKLTPDSTNFGFGVDVVDSPSRITVLGAHQEGFLNSSLLGGIDGIDAPAGTDFTFTPAWDSISVSFWDAYGIYRTYSPTETELKCALKSIEHWSYYKIYQNAGGTIGWSDGVDAGTSGAEHHTFQSRYDPMMPVSDFTNNPESGVRLITNRIDTDHNWVLEWYAKIQNHASAHYGRTYALSGIAFNEAEGEYKIIQAAWCNLENQRANTGQPYSENYEIHNQYAPVAPFITQDFKVQAHCVLPSSTLYGPEGLSVPASFADWNEDAHPSGVQSYDHYIPVSLSRVGQNVINPRAAGNAFEDYPEGTIIAQLPVLAGTGLLQSAQLSTVVTTFEQAAAAAQSGLLDALDPRMLVGVHPTLTGVAIPVQIRNRYGQVYPAAWASGSISSGTRDTVITNDNYAPWNYFPVNTQSSVDVMSTRVSGVIHSQLIDVSESRFADITKIDWPIISFDGFANQNQVSGVYGRRDHGITTISVNVNNGVPQTKYSIKSFFSEFGKEAPLGERNAAVLNGIIHPIDYTAFEVSNPQRPAPTIFNYGLPVPAFNAEISPSKYVWAVTITQVDNRGSTTSPERYHSQTKDGVPKPGGAVDPLDPLDLICRDGFFNVGDHATYIVEYKKNGQRRRYYTGGTDLTTGAFVVVVDTVNASDVDVTYRGFSVPTVPVLPGVDIDNITAGDTGKLVSDGVQRPQNEGNITGIRPAITAAGKGIYFDPAAVGGAGEAGEPAIITAIANLGESGALASVQKVFPSGANAQAGPSGAVTGTVYPLPWAAFAQSGDVGVYVSNGPDKFIYISRIGFSNLSL